MAKYRYNLSSRPSNTDPDVEQFSITVQEELDGEWTNVALRDLAPGLTRAEAETEAKASIHSLHQVRHNVGDDWHELTIGDTKA